MVHLHTSIQDTECAPLKNKGDQGGSNPPLGQASWRAIDILPLNAGPPGLIRVGFVQLCFQPESTTETHCTSDLDGMKLTEEENGS